MDSLLPPYTPEERYREMVMRTRALHWRIQRLQAKHQHVQVCGASECAGPWSVPIMTRLLPSSEVTGAEVVVATQEHQSLYAQTSGRIPLAYG